MEAEFERLVMDPPVEHPHFAHAAPEFTRLHPRAANIFGNMHTLHDIVGDILTDDTIVDKRRAIYEARDMMLAGRVPAATQGEVEHEH